VFGELIEAERRPASCLRRLGGMELSIRAINLSLLTDQDLGSLGIGYEVLFNNQAMQTAAEQYAPGLTDLLVWRLNGEIPDDI
jgi:hypothetical protein